MFHRIDVLKNLRIRQNFFSKAGWISWEFCEFFQDRFLLGHLRLTTSAAFMVFLFFFFYFFNSTSKILVTLVTLALRVANLTQKPVQRFLSYLWKWLKADKNKMLVNYNDTTKGHSSLWNMGLGWKLNLHNEHRHSNICSKLSIWQLSDPKWRWFGVFISLILTT